MIGTNVRRFRKELDISQEELANRIGLTQGGIGQIERNEVSPRLETIYALAEALGVEVAVLLQRERKPASIVANQ